MNNTAKHTPGPWEVVGSRICTIETDSSRITLAKTEPNGAFAMDETQAANAHLIAAAPAMYEALQTLVEYLSAQVPADTLDDWKHVFAARQALAQAEGK